MTTPEPLPQSFLPFTSPEATLATVGGKALNLAKLANAGISIPNGFFIPTVAYKAYVEHNALGAEIEKSLKDVDPTSPEELAAASARIRNLFKEGVLQPGFAASLEIAWRWLGAHPVAVRSSATAEDLPGMSFAGQQDTLLNVMGDEALAAAVVSCWSSLWTARAIGYRARNRIPHETVSLSVIVQTMVPSQASGVLFTANPLTGVRSETVIDATLGLGEALVGGHVEPDHYVIDANGNKILHKFLGSKSVVIRGKPGGGVVTQEIDSSTMQAIPDEVILRLAEIGKEIQALYGFPQDIEWAYLPTASSKEGGIDVEGEIHILQSRPITALYPIPEGMGPDPIQVLFSFGAVQGLLDPMTPLGRDAIRLIFAGGASLFGFNMTHETQGVIKMAGERLWANITPVLRHPVGAEVVPRIFSGIDPGSLDAVNQVLSDPRLEAGKGRLRFSTLRRFAKFALGILVRVARFAHKPEDKAELIRRRYEAQIGRLRGKSTPPGEGNLDLAHAVALFREIRTAFIYAVPEIATGAIAGLVPLAVLSRFSHHLTGSGDLALEITRGLPNNVTTKMDLILWKTARTIQSDRAASGHLKTRTAQVLAAEYQEGRLPGRAQEAVASFLEIYGMRGLGEIDIGRPRWREDPTHIMQVLQSYLQIEDESMAPDAVFKRGAHAAEEAVTKLTSAARETLGGRIKARVIRAAARRVRALAGLRESPKFFIIKMMGIIRKGLLEEGKDLVFRGILDQPEDLFFLYLNELQALAQGETQDWKALVAGRRAAYASEMRRKQIPRLMLSDGRTFYEGITAAEGQEGVLKGSPVSPGSVEGSVRVVLNPQHANLAPGEILVCPGTDPAWTPLFLAAGGLVMEVGGMMTHGAIVAREYGIPAVVGVDRATERLKTGDKIRVDGSTGIIEVMG